MTIATDTATDRIDATLRRMNLNGREIRLSASLAQMINLQAHSYATRDPIFVDPMLVSKGAATALFMSCTAIEGREFPERAKPIEDAPAPDNYDDPHDERDGLVGCFAILIGAFVSAAMIGVLIGIGTWIGRQH